MVEAAKTLVHSAKIIITFSIEDLCSPSLSIVNRQDPTVEFMKSLCQGILLRNIVSSLAHTAFNEQWCAWEKGILSFNAAEIIILMDFKMNLMVGGCFAKLIIVKLGTL